MEITRYRDQEASREHRQLLTATYNFAHNLVVRSATGILFASIWSMQYLAILDVEEWIFLDGIHKY